MESSYGVGVANRYALLMDDDDVGHVKGGKENKDNASKGKVAPGKATTATGASNRQQQPQAATKNASNSGKALPGNKQQQQQTQQHSKPAGKGGKVDQVNLNNNNIHAFNSQVNQGKSPRNHSSAANDAAKSGGGQGGFDESRPRLDHRGPARDRPPRQDRPPRPQTDSHGNGPHRDNDEARKNRRNREDRAPLQQSTLPGEGNVEGIGEGRGNRGPRNPKFAKGDRPPRTGGPRGSRTFGSDNRDGRGKPVFDRHSGSDKAGIKPVEKRDGAGAHNWGTYTDDLEASQVASEEARPEKTAADESNEQGEAHTDGEAEPAKETQDEGPKELTLEEYRKQLGNGKKHQPKFKIRKPGEGEDNAQWKKTYLLKKDEEEEEIEEIEEIEVLKEETRHNKKKVIDIDIRFTNTFRGGDDRGRGGRGGGGGGRGGGRQGGGPDERRKRTQTNGSGGGGGGGGNFTNRKQQTAPKVDDINDFPSLGVAA